MNLHEMSNGTLEREERRLMNAREDAVRMRRGKMCDAILKKLNKVRKEIERRKYLQQ